jgi:hypothetical protein
MARKPNSNISMAKKLTLHTLQGNADLTVLPAGKGNATVFLDTLDYKEKVLSLLDEASRRPHAVHIMGKKMLPSSTRSPQFLKMSPNKWDHMVQCHLDCVGFLRSTKWWSL